MEPVYAFDREVIPAGTVALGKVSRTQPVESRGILAIQQIFRLRTLR